MSEQITGQALADAVLAAFERGREAGRGELVEVEASERDKALQAELDALTAANKSLRKRLYESQAIANGGVTEETLRLAALGRQVEAMPRWYCLKHEIISGTREWSAATSIGGDYFSAPTPAEALRQASVTGEAEEAP